MSNSRFYLKGFTLIEVQIAILILILIFGIITGVLYFSAKVWKSSQQLTQRHNEQQVVGALLHQQISGVLPLTTSSAGEPKALFEGEENSIYYMGNLPPYLVRGGPWLINLYLNDTKQLILRYRPIDSTKTWQVNKSGNYQHVAILNDVKSFSIMYFPLGEVDGDWRAIWKDKDFPALVKFQIEQSSYKWPEQVDALRALEADDLPFHSLMIDK